MKSVGQIAETPQGHPTKRKRPLYALYVANAVSYVGNDLTLLAIPWFVLQTTGSVTKTGITAFFSTLPTVLSAFFGSAVVDRLGYKRTSVISDIASCVGVALVPLLYSTVGLAFWQLLVLVFLGGLLKAPGVTARSALVPDLAMLAQAPLERANSLSDGVRRVAGFISGPIAGVLIALLGASNLLWFDGASFLFSAILVIWAIPPTAPIAKSEEGQDYFAKLWEGLRFIRHDAFLFAIVLTAMITNLLDGAMFSVVEPAYVKFVFGSAVALGFMVAAFGGAAFVGTLTFGAIGHRLPRRLTFSISFIIVGILLYAPLVFMLPLPAIIACYILAGLAVGPLNPLLSTIQQERVPVEMRARVFGTITAGALVGIPVGTILSGYAVSLIGLHWTLFAMGVCYLLTTLSLLVNPGLRDM